jgi:hypothetical protein
LWAEQYDIHRETDVLMKLQYRSGRRWLDAGTVILRPDQDKKEVARRYSSRLGRPFRIVLCTS